MLYFHKRNLVLFATPKTASTSLEQVLAPHADIVLQGDPGIKHCTFQRYCWRFEKFTFIFNAKVPPETVALVREPEDWLGSWFRFRHGSWVDGTPRSTRGLTFAQFIEAYLSDTPPPFAAVGSQTAFLTHPPQQRQVQTLWRYDALPAFQTWLQGELGLTLDLPQTNVSPRFGTPLPDDLRGALRAKLASDYALYEGAREV
ncbi:MAG: gamma-glutamyl kinase [Roseinatronobacter sp.]